MYKRITVITTTDFCWVLSCCTSKPLLLNESLRNSSIPS